MGQLDVLKAELIAGHPITGAYSLDATLAAAELNAVNRTLPVNSLSSSQVLNAVDPTEYGTLTNGAKDTLWRVLSLNDINPNGVERQLLLSVFPGGGSFDMTRAALQALTTRDVSRAEELGLGVVYPGTVEQARAL